MIYEFFNCREKRKGTLTIDKGDPITDVSEQGATQLDTDGYLWLGTRLGPPISSETNHVK